MNKIKIGIITLQGEDNFGNVLQNYAVQRIFEKLGCEVCTLDNQTKNGFFIPMEACITFWMKLRPSYILHYFREKTRVQNVKDLNPLFFLKNVKLAKRARKLEAIRHRKFSECKKKNNNYVDIQVNANRFVKEEYEEFYAMISGSDQVWNPYYASTSSVNFLRFVPEHRRIAFAASFGVANIPVQRREIYKKWIMEIPSISVREKSGAVIVKDLTGRDVPVLLDPTFAITKREWMKYAKRPEFLVKKKAYVLEYFLGNRTIEYERWIKRYARVHKLNIVSIHDMHYPEYYTVDPMEFVWLISHAAIVMTDSFHGVAFSINLNTQFIAFERNEVGQSMTSRIESLLDIYGLNERIFKYSRTDIILKNIDFSVVNQITKIEKERICEFAQKAITGVAKGNKMPLLPEASHCTGCLACYNKCRAGAINIKIDDEGFFYPYIESDKCVGCMQCQSVCPQDRVKKEHNELKSFYATAKDDKVLRESSSGGVFYYLASEIIGNGGWVYGAVLDNESYLRHIGINNIHELYKLQTSKYIQSDMGMVYREIKEKLERGIPVLFCGTPCHVAALKRYLGFSCENLFLVDFICHGVPSPLIWKKYRKEISNKPTGRINFRDKRKGWRNFGLSIRDEKVNYYKTVDEDPYLKAFMQNLSLRPSCYDCQYKGDNYYSDLTVSDFWGVSALQPQQDNTMGVSLVIIRSEKGRMLFENIADTNFKFGEVVTEDALKYNKAAYISPEYKIERDIFFRRIHKEPITQVANDIVSSRKIERRLEQVLIICSRLKKFLRGIKENV